MSHAGSFGVVTLTSFADGPSFVTDDDAIAHSRRRRLLQRLDGLAEDAMLEGCENAAQVLRDAANTLRTAIIQDAWARHPSPAAASRKPARPLPPYTVETEATNTISRHGRSAVEMLA